MSCNCQKKTSYIIDMSKISDFVSLRQDCFAESSAVLEASVDVSIKAVKATCNNNTVLDTVLDICHFYVIERGLFHPCSLYLIWLAVWKFIVLKPQQNTKEYKNINKNKSGSGIAKKVPYNMPMWIYFRY